MKLKLVIAFLFVLYAFAGLSHTPPGPVDSLQPGQWYEVPNSKLRTSGVAYPNNPSGLGDISQIISIWNGGAFDSKRDRLIIWGGGHGVTYRNDVYTFDLNLVNQGVQAWGRAIDPSLVFNNPETEVYYPDGHPRSRHTYGYLTYIPDPVDRFLTLGGTAFAPNGNVHSDHVDAFNFTTGDWEIQKFPDLSGGTPASMYGAISDYDPSSGHVWYMAPSGGHWLIELNPAANGGAGAWIDHGNTYTEPTPIGYYMTGALDPVRHLFVAIGCAGTILNEDSLQLQSCSGNGEVRWWNAQPGTQAAHIATLSGNFDVNEIIKERNPGFVFDPAIGKFVAWGASLTDPTKRTCVYTLDPGAAPYTAAWVLEKIPAAATNTVTPTHRDLYGTYGRFRYSPSKNVFVLVNSADDDVFIYKLGVRNGETIPPSAPTALTATTVSATQIDLNWTASVDNVGVAGYIVYRGSNQVASVTAPSYQDTNLSPSTPYSYAVAAFDAAGNLSALSASVSAVTQSTTFDTAPPSVPTGLTATPLSSSQINLSWNASSDNVGVAGYRLYRDGLLLASTTSIFYSDTILSPTTSYSYRLAAFDTAGNQSAQCNAVTAQTPAIGQLPVLTFSQLCAQPGVLKCVGFNSNADIPLGAYYQPYQSFGSPSGIDYIVSQTNPSFNGVPPTIDTTTYASDGGSLKFTIPSQSPANTSGDYFTNFPPVYPGSEFYIRWKMRFSTEFLSTHFTNSDGFKVLAVGKGDHANCSPQAALSIDSGGGCSLTHSPQNIVIENINQYGIPRMYHHSDETIEFDNSWMGPILWQNARPSPSCGYHASGNCFQFYANEWMTFELHVKVGTWFIGLRNAWNAAMASGTTPRNSQVELWGGREGQPMEYIISFNHFDLINNDPTHYGNYGKVWLLPYQTNKDPTQVHPICYVWYDELIISTRPIGALPLRPGAPANAKKK